MAGAACAELGGHEEAEEVIELTSRSFLDVVVPARDHSGGCSCRRSLSPQPGTCQKCRWLGPIQPYRLRSWEGTPATCVS